MRRAIVTYADAAYEPLLDVSLPTMQRYGDAHDWMVIAVRGPGEVGRAPSWSKIPLLHEALAEFDEVLWIDADVIVAEDAPDISDDVPDEFWQALVEHHTGDGDVPNCGVWLLRPPMRGYLSHIWDMVEYLNHGWWEQAALMQLLGYEEHPRPARHVTPTTLYRSTWWLDRQWNSHEQSDRHPDPHFAHATAGNLLWRLDVMRRYAAMIPASGGIAR